ncbi:site-specific DNA-methyltransferase [Sinorhizobium meliloti]|uniref:site-specific DNA-methyltransferase n=1 Tax=Rhizobium meliloti TaxID=382 RepID=UPI000FDBBF1F|nr:site-specific DNA-methyltransferase [Sinorhizobium meliloti]RVI34224.1 site-specific DNA-methyltransferase [Sinorhizobium meliloti]
MNKPEHTQPEKMDLRSMDVAQSKRDELKRCLGQAFPEVFAEGVIDFDQLKRALGKWVDPSKERFGLNWPGKAQCMKIVQQPSVATLKPVREDSVSFDETENLFIEGDNLEVLKLLQKSYFGKVKMIYIDPPYNTGNEFIYPDKFAETLETYLAYTGQIDDERRKFSTNSESEGRYHSRWLSMMYSRLYLARNLLRDDGSIFISIDDHEQHNLRHVCNDIFGEENFVATVIWHKMDSPKNTAVHFSEDHEYILVYSRNAETWRPNLLPRTEEMTARYKNPDNDPRGPWLLSDLAARNYYSQGRYPITTPSGKVISGPPAGSYWRVSKDKFDELHRDNRIWWGAAGDNRPGMKRFLSDVKDGVVPQTYWNWKDVGSTRHSKQELSQLMEAASGEDLFITPKPVALMKRILQIGTSGKEPEVVLDFFAGSATIAQAVLEKNIDDGGSRSFVCVQLPEYMNEDNTGTIADTARERIRRAAKKISDAKQNELDLKSKGNADLGFKAFRLGRSNFRLWEGEAIADDQLSKQLEMHIDHLSDAASAEDVLYELLLKAGFQLTTRVTALEMAEKRVFSVEDGALLICLDKEITPELIDELAEANPLQVICLDEGFKGNDQLKANAVQTFKARAQAEESEIVFKTV